MRSRDGWANRVKRRLEEAGYKVRLLDPAFALERKMAGRLRDSELLALGRSPKRIQRMNSLFGSRAKRFRIVDFGGLNDGK